MTRVAVVIVNYRTPDLALAAARSVVAERRAVPGLALVLVDGGSDDDSAARIARGLADPLFEGWATALPLPVNGGFGWANNQAILPLLQSADPPDFIYLLNPDATIEPGAIARLVAVMADHPKAGAAGSRILEADGTPSGSHFLFPTPTREFLRGARTGLLDRLLRTSGGELPLADRVTEADWVTGACVLLRAEALRDAGVFDSGFFLYFEEVELMWRMRRRGWTVLHDPASRAVHLAGASTGISGATTTRRPAYLYESQARFLMLTGGRGHATAAGLAWLAGYALRHLRALVERRGTGALPHEARDRLTRGKPRPAYRERADTRWTQAPGKPPLWMARG